jgi:hypothetical protein
LILHFHFSSGELCQTIRRWMRLEYEWN